MTKIDLKSILGALYYIHPGNTAEIGHMSDFLGKPALFRNDVTPFKNHGRSSCCTGYDFQKPGAVLGDRLCGSVGFR